MKDFMKIVWRVVSSAFMVGVGYFSVMAGFIRFFNADN